jgi:hypothetical protein
MDFMVFKHAVAAQFERMQQGTLFRANIGKDEIWAAYMGAFPPGTNPIYRERTEYDCSCCKQFIRAVGDVIAVIDDKLVTIWDVQMTSTEPDFQHVARAMARLVRDRGIADRFLHYEAHAGTDKNFEEVVGGSPMQWNHFFVNIKSTHVLKKDLIATKLNDYRSTRDVYHRSLKELSVEAAETVLELIAQGSLYRGDEHKATLQAFVRAKRAFDALPNDNARSVAAWTAEATGPVSRIRNTAIGTLLIDLTEGTELEDAVRKFEAVVAPANYKRPTALISKAQIEKAKATLEELGLTSSLERRYATLRDISVNDILFADRAAKKVINGTVFDDLLSGKAGAVRNTTTLDKVEEVPIGKFISDILPRAESVEVLLENTHANNLMSLIGPADPTAGMLFKWPNRFSWSYNGDMADSIKERVKKAGGNVTGELCCRLAWDYVDDLDFHMYEPGGGHINFTNRRSLSGNGGMLDVDANGADGVRAEPVENIFYSHLRNMRPGEYKLVVHNYSRRSDGAGFEVEIDIQGTIHRFAYPKVVRGNEKIEVAKLRRIGAGIEISPSIESTTASKIVWGLPTQAFHKVNLMMLSPNYWDGYTVGNQHYFFILEGCKNDGTARGFFNEFLKTELDVHRKVFEVVGSKMKAVDSDEQLSGLGFSSTQRAALICRVKGSFTRQVKIVF